MKILVVREMALKMKINQRNKQKYGPQKCSVHALVWGSLHNIGQFSGLTENRKLVPGEKEVIPLGLGSPLLQHLLLGQRHHLYSGLSRGQALSGKPLPGRPLTLAVTARP